MTEPDDIIPFTGMLTAEQVAGFEAEWKRLTSDPAAARAHMRRQMRRLLSRRTRARLCAQETATRVGSWLAGRGPAGCTVAVLLWRACGMWRS